MAGPDTCKDGRAALAEAARGRQVGRCWLLLLAGFSACAFSSGVPPHPTRWANAWINSLNSHRWEQVFPLLEASGTYEDPLTGRPLEASGTFFYWTRMWAAFPELRFAVQRVTGDGRGVVIEWTAAGVSEATPAPSGAFVIQLRKNTIVSVRGYYNALPFIFHTTKPAPPA